MHQGQNHFPTNTLSKGGVNNPICQPFEHWSHTNIVKLPTQHTTTSNKSNCHWWINLAIHVGEMTWCVITYVVLPCLTSWASNINILQGKTFHTCRITHLTLTSKIFDVVYCKYTKTPSSNLWICSWYPLLWIMDQN
jgi:hypothetical protein